VQQRDSKEELDSFYGEELLDLFGYLDPLLAHLAEAMLWRL